MNTGEDTEKQRKWEEDSESLHRTGGRARRGGGASAVTLRKRRRGKEEERMEGNSKRGRDGRKDVAREKKTLSPPMRGREGGG